MQAFRKTKGAISIFLILIMVPVFIFSGIIIDGSRISAAKTAVSGAGDLAANAALSEYDRVLKDIYGLFAVSESEEELQDNVSKYFYNTINNANILDGSDSYTRNFLNSIGNRLVPGDSVFENMVDTRTQSLSINPVPASSIANPKILERQIVEYMKYRGPVSIGNGLMAKIGCIKETSKQTKVLESKLDYESGLNTVQEACDAAYRCISGYNNKIISTGYNSSSYLKLINDDLNQAYEYSIKMTEYALALKYYSNLGEDEKQSYKDGGDGYSEYVKKFGDVPEPPETCEEAWKAKACEYGRMASELLYDKWYINLDDIIASLEDGIKALENVLSDMDGVDKAREKWNESLGNLSDGDVKTAMKGDYNNSARDIDAGSVKALINLLDDLKQHFNEIKELLCKITYFNNKVCDNNKETDFLSWFSDVNAGDIELKDELSLRQAAEEYINKNYVNLNTDMIKQPGNVKVTEKQRFYKYLMKICYSQNTDGAGAEESKTLKSNLIEAGNTGLKEEPEDDEGKELRMSDVISQDISLMIRSFYEGSSVTENNSISLSETDTKGKDSDIAGSNKKNLEQIGTFFDSLAEAGEAIRDNIYLEEYITGMFSCYTSCFDTDGSRTEEVMSLFGRDPLDWKKNFDLSKNMFYGSEIEYILWGNDNIKANINNTKALIFGLRFALNSVYAFSSSEIRTPAMSAATAIAGWTGFGVPLVQSVIILAWSMAESVIDVNTLCAGKAVPVYKNNQTWNLGINGLKDRVADAVKEVSQKAVDDIFTKINDTALEKIDDIQTGINDYIEQTADSVIDNAVSTLTIPLQQMASSIVGSFSTGWTREDIAERVDIYFSELEELIEAENDGTAKTAKICGLGIIRNSFREKIIDKIYECCATFDSAVSNSVSDALGKIDALTDDIKDAVTGPITDKVSETGEWLRKEVESAVNNLGDNVKEKTLEAVEKYTEKLGGSKKTGNNQNAIVSSGGFSLTYKEYIKVFLLMFMISDKSREDMLERIARLMQVNVQSYNGEFNIAKAYTMFETQAVISVRTTFFAIPVIKSTDSKPVAEDRGYEKAGVKWQEIPYRGIRGY